MLVETTKYATRPRKSKSWRRRVWVSVVAGMGFVFCGIAVPLSMNPEFTWELFKQVRDEIPALKEMSGLGAFSGKRQILKAYADDVSHIADQLKDLPKSYFGGSNYPTLTLDIKFKHLRKIHDKRAAALKRGYLVTGTNDYVPARIRFGGQTHRVKVRLKGDLPDHYETDRWSLRVAVKDGGHILGVRRFSLQAPKTRQYHGQPLYLDFMRQFDVLAPRYRFVDMWVNGTNIGIMALEEHFSKELLESQGRRDSVILAFDESLVWENGLRGFFDDYTNASIKAFRFGRIAKSKRLLADYCLAAGLLRGVVDGRLTPAEVFDVDRLGRYIAIAQLWGSRHDTAWTNLRFYFNPITARLEPIAFDGMFPYWRISDQLVEGKQVLVSRLMADEAVYESYLRALRHFTAQVLDGDLLADLARQEKLAWLKLASEYPLLEPFPFDKLKRRAKALAARHSDDLRPRPNAVLAARAADLNHEPPAQPFSQLVHAYRIACGEGNVLELRNAIPETVEVRSIAWMTIDGVHRLPFHARDLVTYPLQLLAKPLYIAAKPHLIPFLPPPLKQPLRLMVETRRAGSEDSVWSEAVSSVPVLEARPIPDASVSQTLARHRFLRWDASSKHLVVQRGDWRVTDDLVVPAGVGLKVNSGTRLRFVPGRALIAHGPLFFRGATDEPIVLEAASDSWQGVAVLEAGAESQWRHVVVRGTRGVSRGNWSLTGGVTFYQSPIEMRSVRLIENSSEDALNIVSSQFALLDVDIEQTASDAFDSDFSSGRIVGGVYRNIGGTSGGDGIDVSGSKVSIEDVRFVGVSDKALSVGEGSRVDARNLQIRDASTGAASKDGSTLILTDSVIAAPRVAGLMAYQKKPIYGSARLDARRVTVTGDAPAALAQNGSRITVDNTPVIARSLDVDRLYKTVMRKGDTQ